MAEYKDRALSAENNPKPAPLSAYSNHQGLLGVENSTLGWKADLVREGVCVWLHRNCCCGQRELLKLQAGAVASFHFGVFFCFSASSMLEFLFKEETWTLLEPTSGTAPCHPSCSLGQVQGSTNKFCCFPSPALSQGGHHRQAGRWMSHYFQPVSEAAGLYSFKVNLKEKIKKNRRIRSNKSVVQNLQ